MDSGVCFQKTKMNTKVTKSNTVRLTPPLTIRENDLSIVCEKIKKVVDQL